ncbi:flavodoxin-dependent (E)-4-hydroxy-3-methylbut-2-enyl-diphosphate synthase [Candidatus Deianiraea vastatrix]|uniref:4-hydroxy-3-methylbut-2-en-1-yl diphosphate synthase (flavodoxin) n=1 Tax=Candidatus Deianiraea vastatrix TaxID=2163644 RepID=A0A5B8XFZ3_9RICK|nr:flavodoxin-dependent (E)-4-hydroxy-3-methylbut-2-enyl-diphosphate synthase [Candidatus Deianiraea vastatrix]QED22897.1 4-hydroxy-3-methylbut-2-en-1-yl diphosphate synthase [Candidatus Deianiraea vastatrix]
MSFEYKINRKKTREISVGDVKIGAGNPIVVQTMTNTLTSDAKATLEQIERCVKAGAEVIRVSVPDKESTDAMREISKNSPVPIIADVHFHYKRGIEAAQNGAKCLRINPGTIGSIDRAKEVVKAAKDNGCSIRIGVNAGSLEEKLLEKYQEPCPDALLESAMESVKILEDLDFYQTKISVKASDVMLAIKSYELLSAACDYPLHLGITEAGTRNIGTVRSSIGLGHLLMQGIGDTMRVSLSISPEEEIAVAYDILKSLKLRNRGVNIISCPSCARQQFDVCKTIAKIEAATAHIVKPISISVLGCVVNGIGEAKHTNIGITGAGSGQHLVYINGKPDHKIPAGSDVADHVIKLALEMDNE